MLRPTLLRSFIVRMRNVYRLSHAGDAFMSGVSSGSPVKRRPPAHPIAMCRGPAGRLA